MNADIFEIQRIVASVAHHIDRKRWPELRALYAETVHTDYTSLFGGSPQPQAGDALIAGWHAALGSVVTQHLLGPIDVELEGADRATAVCHVRALHHASRAASGTEWEVLGHYVFGLERRGAKFRITSMRLETFHQTGNRKLLQEAGGAG